VTSLEVRPALQATLDVIDATHGSSIRNTAVGMGPNTFGLMWLAHKPASVNQSQFWNLDFNVGYSTLVTAFGAVGLIGAIMWLVPILAVLYLLWRTRANSDNRLMSWTLGGGAVVLWSVIVMYVPSPDMIVLAMALAGATIGLLAGANRYDTRTASRIAVVVLVLALVWTGYASGKRYVAEAYVGQAAQSLQAGDLTGAAAYINASLGAEQTPENLRAALAVGGTALQQMASAPASSSTQQQFAATLQQTIAFGQQAIALDPIDYRSYLALGQVYDLLAVNKVDGAYAQAKAAYQAAETYSPLNPAIPLTLAKLEANAGTVQGLQDALKQSLTLKPDYTDAILFLAQIDIARNDLASAINDTKVAAQTAPGVASIWYQLGLLYYAGGDTKDAIAPLEQAIKIQPDYANAQYYLGLAYYAQGRNQDAITQFQALATSNPDNSDVKSILSNLLVGKPPIAATSTAQTSKKK
jgi:tetratricopeptide (TPR) repeat protein